MQGVVDDSVLPQLQHSLDVRSSAPGADGKTFTATFLAPLSWQLTSDNPTVFEGADGGFVAIALSIPEPGFDREAYLAGLRADEFFTVPTVEFEGTIDGVNYVVLLEGDADTATAAMVFAEVDSLLVTCRLYTPENNDLLFEMLDTLRFLST